MAQSESFAQDPPTAASVKTIADLEKQIPKDLSPNKRAIVVKLLALHKTSS
jgi:hypothetical protein